MFVFLALASAAPSDDFKKLVLGNWSASVATVEGTSPFSNLVYHIRVNKVNDDEMTVGIYQDNESTEAISEYSIFYDKTDIFFGKDRESAQTIGLFANLRANPTATGVYEEFAYNFIIMGLTKLQLQLINRELNTFVTLNILKDIDRSPLPWYKKYGQKIVLGVVFFASQGFSAWNQNKMMAKSRELAAKKAEAEKAEKTEDKPAEEKPAEEKPAEENTTEEHQKEE